MTKPAIAMTLAISAIGAAGIALAGPAAADPGEVRSAICDFARNMGNYTYRDADGYWQRVVDRSTGDFQSWFKQLWKDSLRDNIISTHARGEIGTPDCTVTSVDHGHAEGSYDSYETITSDSGTQTKHVVMSVGLDYEHGNWLVSRGTPVSGNS